MSSKYIIIDKLIINEGKSFDFDLFRPSSSEKSIESFKGKGVLITLDDEKKAKEKKALYYIDKEDKSTYEEYYKTYLTSLKTIKKNKTLF